MSGPKLPPALTEALAQSPARRPAAVRAALLAHAAQMIPEAVGGSLEARLRHAASLPRSDASRAFAVVLMRVLDAADPRGETERAIQSFIEQALLNPLRRAGYPFDGPVYDKRQALRRLATEIEPFLRVPEDSIPRWIHGLGPDPRG